MESTGGTAEATEVIQVMPMGTNTIPEAINE